MKAVLKQEVFGGILGYGRSYFGDNGLDNPRFAAIILVEQSAA
jgi:hypothetical protein